MDPISVGQLEAPLIWDGIPVEAAQTETIGQPEPEGEEQPEVDLTTTETLPETEPTMNPEAKQPESEEIGRHLI